MSEGKIETPRQYYKRYITANKYDDTDMFTKAMVMVFSFQDAYEEKCAALSRCQDRVHELEHQVMEFSGHLMNFCKALNAKDGDDMLELLYNHFKHVGMSLRDYLAAQVIGHLVSSPLRQELDTAADASYAYKVADLMLKEREK